MSDFKPSAVEILSTPFLANGIAAKGSIALQPNHIPEKS